MTVNADGFENLSLKFTLRSVPSLLGTIVTNRAPAPGFFVDFTGSGQAPNPPERLGWGNDAPPLRDFALGAVLQHFTKSILRRPGVDFRVPSDRELDDLAAYQMSIGRDQDLDLTKLELRVQVANRGRRLFLDTGNIGEPGHKNCNACHFNGGGTVGFAFNPDAPGFTPRLDGNPRGFNAVSGINTNEAPLALALGIPRDGGFGVTPLPGGGFGNIGNVPGFGPAPVEEFAIPSLVEAGDTAPYFHNHSALTLEDSIAFYGSAPFRAINSVGGPIGPIPVSISSNPSDPEVRAIAAFLRTLTALDNLRSALSLIERGRLARVPADAREMARLAMGEIRDAQANLRGGVLGRARDGSLFEARAHLEAARSLLAQAADEQVPGAAAQAAWGEAANAARRAREALADPETLPRSYRR